MAFCGAPTWNWFYVIFQHGVWDLYLYKIYTFNFRALSFTKYFLQNYQINKIKIKMKKVLLFIVFFSVKSKLIINLLLCKLILQKIAMYYFLFLMLPRFCCITTNGNRFWYYSALFNNKIIPQLFQLFGE